MDWLERMTKDLDYIEHHMEGEFEVAEAARAVYSSPFHFQRMFYMLTGLTVAEYIRKRRLTLAAQELASSKAKVLDVALKYGYESPESYSKAFRKVHGVNPSAAREPGVSLKAYPRLSFQISLKGDKDMDYKIIEKEAFPVVGKEIRVTTKDGENFKRIPRFWNECIQSGVCEKLRSMAGQLGILGVCMEFSQEQEEFSYLIAVERPEKLMEDDFVEKQIPASLWAIFESIGPMPDAIQKVWKRIFSEWFPATGYEHAGTPELEVYSACDPSAADYRCEVWIPIVRK